MRLFSFSFFADSCYFLLLCFFFLLLLVVCVGGGVGGGGWVFSSQFSIPSEEKIVRLRCQGKASLEMEAKTVEYFLHMKSA